MVYRPLPFKRIRIRTRLPYIKPAPQYQHKVGLCHDQISPPISICTDHSNAVWRVTRNAVDAEKRRNCRYFGTRDKLFEQRKSTASTNSTTDQNQRLFRTSHITH